MSGGSFTKGLRLSENPDTQKMTTGWNISGSEKLLFKDAAFIKTGELKTQNKLVLTKMLPGTAEQSICFVTIGYRVEAFIDGKNIYAFGSSLNSDEVWGVKTHLFKLPDGKEGRELKLVFTTNHPSSIAVSRHVLLGDTPAILSALIRSTLFEIIFSLFYISIGAFILIFSFISIAFKLRKFDIALLSLAFVALFIGMGIFFNLSVIAYFTGPVFVYWIVNISKLAIPIWVLLFVAADKNFEKSRLLTAMTVVQCVFLCGWVFCNLFNLDLFLLDWNLPLFILLAVILAVTFIQEFMTGIGRPAVTTATAALFLTFFIDTYIYFTSGDYYTMDYNVVIAAFPVLVLMTGKTILSSIQKEYRIMSENMTLRLEGELLYKNYQQTEKYIEETKIIWHDIDKHFSVMSRLAKNGEYDELNCYLEHSEHDMKETKSAYLCENKLVNAILTDKFSEAQSKGIQTSFTGNLPEKLHIQGNDICSLLVNMLDNAIEACGKVPYGKEKKLELNLGMKNDFVYFSVTNSFVEAPVVEDGEFITSKEDKSKHGYGIFIIQRIVRKYNGAFDIIPSQGSFMVRAALKNESAEGLNADAESFLYDR
jgi:signal transduction histidine kinase